MTKIKEQILEEKRTFKKETSLGKIQDRITKLELKIEELEKLK